MIKLFTAICNLFSDTVYTPADKSRGDVLLEMAKDQAKHLEEMKAQSKLKDETYVMLLKATENDPNVHVSYGGFCQPHRITRK